MLIINYYQIVKGMMENTIWKVAFLQVTMKKIPSHHMKSPFKSDWEPARRQTGGSELIVIYNTHKPS